MPIEWKAVQLDPEAPMYLALARAIEERIQGGQLAPGERLPTHRGLAAELGLARSTVRRAYDELERWGLIDSTVGRGTFVRSDVARFGYRAGFEGDVVDLALNHSPSLRASELQVAHVRAIEAAPATWVDAYWCAPRDEAARAAGAEWIRAHGLDCQGTEVQITVGGQQSLALALLSGTRPGDVVAVERLSYPGFRQAADTLGRRLLEIETDEQGMRPLALEEACERERVAGVYLVPTLQNPLSSTVPQKRRVALAKVVEQLNLCLIEDDSLRLLEEDPPAPISSLVPEHSIYVAGFSKVVSGGARVGICRVGARFQAGFQDALWSQMISAPASTLLFAQHVISSGEALEWARSGRAPMLARWQEAAAIAGSLLAPEARPSPYLWLDLPGVHALAGPVANECVRRGVRVLPGSVFGSGPRASRGLRICVTGHDEGTLRRALETVTRAVEERTARPSDLVL